MNIWIVTHYNDWSIGTYAFSSRELAAAKACEILSELIDNAGGEEPDADMIEREGSELQAYIEAADGCGALDGHMVEVDQVTLDGELAEVSRTATVTP